MGTASVEAATPRSPTAIAPICFTFSTPLINSGSPLMITRLLRPCPKGSAHIWHTQVHINEIYTLHLALLLIQQADDKCFHRHQAPDSPIDGCIDLLGFEAATDLGTNLVQNRQTFRGADRGLVQAGILERNGGLVGNRAGKLHLGESKVPFTNILSKHQSLQMLATGERQRQQTLHIRLDEAFQWKQVRLRLCVFGVEYAERFAQAGKQGHIRAATAATARSRREGCLPEHLILLE